MRVWSGSRLGGPRRPLVALVALLRGFANPTA